MGLLLLNGLVLLLDATILFSEWTQLRYGLAFPVLFFAPGYAWLSALYPSGRELDGVERFGLSIPLSIATVSLLGFGLTFSPWGLGILPLSVGLTVLVALLSAVSLVRGSSPSPLGLPASQTRTPGFTRMQVGGIAVAAAAVLGWVAYVTAPPEEAPFTEFYLLDANGMADSYPEQLILTRPLSLSVAIINHEGEGKQYWINALLGGRSVGQAGPLFIEQGEEWGGQLEVLVEDPSAASDEWRQLEVELRQGQADGRPYLRVYLWVKVVTDRPLARVSTEARGRERIRGTVSWPERGG